MQLLRINDSFRYYLNELPYSVEVTDANEIRVEEKEDIPSVLPLLSA